MSKLYVVGTPIGNLSDFSPRAIETLSTVDFIAAEDTRVTVKLLNHFGIKKPMISYHEHNIREKGEYIISRISAGENCAIVTDAGMPCISDPGEDIVRLCHERGIALEVIPGPSALISALAISGLITSKFSFEGFLTVKKSGRYEQLNKIKNDERTIIFYEAPHKLQTTLADIYAVFGNRKIAIARELTKIHEEVFKTDMVGAIKHFEEIAPRGEFVLVVEGAEPPKEEEITFEDAVLMAKEIAEEIGDSAAAKEISKQTGFKKGDLYKALQ
ncbi:MAG: 16S rRNA (cytidine(1402)-2'-O)-methyltransferase [Oscillospiraceae bacterium]